MKTFLFYTIISGTFLIVYLGAFFYLPWKANAVQIRFWGSIVFGVYASGFVTVLLRGFRSDDVPKVDRH